MKEAQNTILHHALERIKFHVKLFCHHKAQLEVLPPSSSFHATYWSFLFSSFFSYKCFFTMVVNVVSKKQVCKQKWKAYRGLKRGGRGWGLCHTLLIIANGFLVGTNNSLEKATLEHPHAWRKSQALLNKHNVLLHMRWMLQNGSNNSPC